MIGELDAKGPPILFDHVLEMFPGGRVENMPVKNIVNAGGGFQVFEEIAAEEGQIGYPISWGMSSGECAGSASILHFKAGKEHLRIKGDDQIDLGEMTGRIAQFTAGGFVTGDLVSVAGATADAARKSRIEFQFPSFRVDPIYVFINQQVIGGIELLADQVLDFVIEAGGGQAQVLR